MEEDYGARFHAALLKRVTAEKVLVGSSPMDAEISSSKRLELLQAECLNHEHLRADIRQKLWSLMKIPVAPASIAAGVVGLLMHQNLIDERIGWSALVIDALWSIYKVLNVYTHCKAKESEQTTVLRNIRQLLDQEQRRFLEAQSIVDMAGIDVHTESERPAI